MRIMSSPIFLLIMILLYLNTYLSNSSPSNAINTISKGQFLSGNQTISSKNGRFELGFFTLGSSGNYYIGIWYKSLPNQTVVWVANREVSVKEPFSSKLLLSEKGNLVLSTTSNNTTIPVWSTKSTTSSRTAAAVLLNTGNLILVVNGSDLNSAHVWQSFEDPTDTSLPGSWIGMNKITGQYQRLTSWKNSEDPSPGLFSEGMKLDGSNQYVIYRNLTRIYWTSGLWNGAYFDYLPSTDQQSIFNFSFIDEKNRKYATYTVASDDIITRGVMGTNGQLVQYIWLESSQQWQSVSASPLRNCDVYELCGPFGVCEEMNTSVCRCLFGFQPANERDWKLNDRSKGCVRRFQLECGNDWFFKMDNMRLPDDPDKKLMATSSSSDCEDSCRNDCSCNAYSYDGKNGCSVWKGDLKNIHQLYVGNRGGVELFLRLSKHDMPPSSTDSSRSNSHGSRDRIGMILGLVLSSIILITVVAIGLASAYRRRRHACILKKVDGSLIRFHYGELRRMTKNFTEKLGSGGFGTVYKGEMPDSTKIAVKSLQGLSQGEKQFRAEVSTLGAIQHVNLVQLLGFCFEGGKNNRRLLVYELMPKGSLDAHLFQHRNKGFPVLDWSSRYQIALGTAKGLAYLHEQCRERIIHCDIKPDNILLDELYVPKVADFGLAKLYDREFSKVLTTMRGTIGYLAPEWISGLEITPKVDVYSYGMMLFEMISGKRNRQNDGEDEGYYYPAWAARKIRNGDVMTILDERLGGEASIEEVSRLGKVAIWCVQDMEERRPTMGQIVQVLEGALEVNMPPISHVLEIHDEAEEDTNFEPYETNITAIDVVNP